MATEKIKVDGNKLVVERTGPGKSDLELSLSDVDSVSFERGGEGENQSDGTLTLFTKNGESYPVRVSDNEVGKYLEPIYAALDTGKSSKKPVQKVVDGEQITKPSEQPQK
jgi:hypothetical protein